MPDREVLKANIDHLCNRRDELQTRNQYIQQQQQTADADWQQIEPEKLRKQAQEQDQVCTEVEEIIEKYSIEINQLR